MDLSSNKSINFIIWTNSAIAGFGIVIFGSWLLHSSFFRQLFPVFTPMRFDTACCFILLTLSLFIQLVYRNKFFQRLSKFLLIIIFSYAAIIIIGKMFLLHFFLSGSFLKANTLSTGFAAFRHKMSILTAICFCLTSISMLGIRSVKEQTLWIVQTMLHAVTIMSFIQILGYFFNIPALYEFHLTFMATNTAFSFFFLSIALSLVNPTIGITNLFTGNGIGNIMSRKLFMQMAFMAIILGYAYIIINHYRLVSTEHGIALFVFFFMLISLSLISKTSDKLNQIASLKNETEDNLLNIKTLLDSTPCPTVIVNENGIIEQVNNLARVVFGYSKAELTGHSINMFIPERYKTEYTDTIQTFLNDPICLTIGTDTDLFLLKKDGSELCVELSLNPVNYNDNLWISIEARDITEQRQREKKIKEIAFRLKLATSNSKVGIWEYNLLNKSLLWDEIMFELYGNEAKKNADINEIWINSIHKDDKERIGAEIQFAVNKQKDFDTEFRITWGDGSIHHLKAKAYVERDVNDHAIRMIGTTWDITAQKEDEEKLKQFSFIIDSSADAIISKKLDGTILTWNSGAEKIFGYTPEEIIGKNVIMLFPPELIVEEQLLMGMIGEGEHIGQYETVRIKKNKEKIYVSITLSPIKDMNGKIVAVSIILRDITKNKELESTLVQLSVLEAKSKEMEQFTYIASHDLRHPLLTILNYAKILFEDHADALNEEATHCIQSIIGSANRMNKLIHGLLDYSRLSKIKDPQLTNCNELMQEALSDLHSIIESSQAKITVGELPIFKAYPLELKQLFQNLITNAIKFKKKDAAPEITISATEDKGIYYFEFADNGIGIEEKDIPKIFLIFQRLHSKDEYEGTGIGLAFCKKIVELHRGDIWVNSAINKGSTFHFTINPIK